MKWSEINDKGEWRGIAPVLLCTVAILFIIVMTFVSDNNSHQAKQLRDARLTATCQPYPVFDDFEREGVWYAICAEPNVGLIARPVKELAK
jgi:hypothetical protein